MIVSVPVPELGLDRACDAKVGEVEADEVDIEVEVNEVNEVDEMYADDADESDEVSGRGTSLMKLVLMRGGTWLILMRLMVRGLLTRHARSSSQYLT